MATRYRGEAAEVRALNAYINLTRAGRSVGTRLEHRLLELGLTESQFGVLETLLHCGPLFQRQLGEKLFTTRANISLIVDGLEEKGWVERERHPDDRRHVKVGLTAAGKKYVKQLFPVHLAAVVREFEVLTADEQNELARLCRKVGLRFESDSDVFSQ
jgi:MarR family transcriptional regulator, 2-MHQ and catechol-resistance regulon repressor